MKHGGFSEVKGVVLYKCTLMVNLVAYKRRNRAYFNILDRASPDTNKFAIIVSAGGSTAVRKEVEIRRETSRGKRRLFDCESIVANTVNRINRIVRGVLSC